MRNMNIKKFIGAIIVTHLMILSTTGCDGYIPPNSAVPTSVSTPIPTFTPAANPAPAVAPTSSPILPEIEENVLTGKMLYKGITVYELFQYLPGDVVAVLGEPMSLYEGEGIYRYEYEDIVFFFDDYTGEMYSFEANPATITIDGVVLDKNRAELINIFGRPEDEGWSSYNSEYDDDSDDEIYEMTYLVENRTPDIIEYYWVYFAMAEPGEKSYTMRFGLSYTESNDANVDLNDALYGTIKHIIAGSSGNYFDVVLLVFDQAQDITLSYDGYVCQDITEVQLKTFIDINKDIFSIIDKWDGEKVWVTGIASEGSTAYDVRSVVLYNCDISTDLESLTQQQKINDGGYNGWDYYNSENAFDSIMYPRNKTRF